MSQFPKFTLSNDNFATGSPIKNSIWLIEKGWLGKLKKTEYFGFNFVPLVIDDNH